MPLRFAARYFVVTVSSIGTPTTILTTLAAASTSSTQLATQVEVDQATGQLQKQLKQKIAALQSSDSGDNALIQSTQAQLTQTQKKLATINQYENQYSTNGNTLSDIQNQLATMQTAITNGDSTTFDNALAMANTDVGNLIVMTPMAPFQPDQILPLKANGLGIQSSATYNLSTPSGQTAAQTAVSSAQTLINQVFQAITSNQLVAGSVSTALTTQVNALNQTLQQTQNTQELNVAAESAQLTQQFQDQEHLIQFALGNSTQLSTALAQMATIPTIPNSPFAVLLNAATPSSSSSTSQGSTPAILSLLA